MKTKCYPYYVKGSLTVNYFKIKYFGEPVAEELIAQTMATVLEELQVSTEDARWLVFTGEAVSNTYNFEDEHIHILFKDGTVKDISEVDNALINQNMKSKVKKYYICYWR